MKSEPTMQLHQLTYALAVAEEQQLHPGRRPPAPGPALALAARSACSSASSACSLFNRGPGRAR